MRDLVRLSLALTLTAALLASAAVVVGHALPATVISFLAGSIDGQAVHLVDIGHMRLVPLTAPALDYDAPVWSPDGTMIAYEQSGALVVVEAATGTIRTLSAVPAAYQFDLTWSSDSQFIAYASAEGVYVYDLHRAQQHSVSEQYAYVSSWSPDGGLLAVVEQDMSTGIKSERLRLLNLATGDSRPVDAPMNYARSLAWSPDSQMLVFVGWLGNGANDIFTLNRDGGDVRQLTTHDSYNDTPVWSPDGAQIAFASTREGLKDIFVMNADGTAVRGVSPHPAADFNPVWSPDGQQLLFGSYRASGGDLYLVDAAGGDARRLTREAFDIIRWMAWQP